MLLNKKNFFILLACIIFSLRQCTLFSAKNTFYSDAEFTLLEKTLNAMEYGYGYDYEIGMNYIYSYAFSKDNLEKKEKAFADIINNADLRTAIGLYEKTLKLQAISDYKMNKYRTEVMWKYYTFIKSDLYEPLKNYNSFLLKYILKKNPSLAQFLEMKKRSIDIEIAKEYTQKEEIVDTF